MHKNIQEQFKVSPSLVFFLIHAVQIGVGILSFQRVIVKYAGYDSWMSILIAGIAVDIIIWMMYKILNHEKSDLVSIHKKLFGKWIGGGLSLVFVFYFFILAILTIRAYLDVIQVWMFPRVNLLSIYIVGALLFYYVISGGFRVVTGISFLGVIIPLYLILTLLFPLEFSHVRNLLPILNHSLKEIVLSSKVMVFSYLGFTTLFFYYPFIKNPEKSQKYAHFGNGFSVFLYLVTALVSFVFYSEGQVLSYLWPTLELWKIIQMPFVERFEYIGLSSWALILLPNITIYLWAASRGMKRIFSINQKKTLIAFLSILVLSSWLIIGHDQVEKLNSYVDNIGLYIVFGYIPFLFLYHVFFCKVRKSQ